MKTDGVLGCVVMAAVCALITGCGSSDEKPAAQGGAGGKAEAAAGSSAAGEAGEQDLPEGGSTSGGTGGASAGSGGASGGVGGNGGASAGSGGAPPVTPVFKSQPAGITLTVDPASDEGLALATTSITQTNGSLFYTEWLGELYNLTDTPQCLIQITGDFQDASGTSVVKFDSYAYGDPYKIGTSALASSCIPPHEGRPVWANAIPGQALPIASIKKLVFTVTPFALAATQNPIPHPSTPTLGALTKKFDASFGEWDISGKATATADIYNASLTFWAKSGDFYVDNEKVYHLENLLKGTSWDFDTAPLGLKTTTLTSVLPMFSFIDGLKGASASIHTGDPLATTLIRRRNDAVAQWENAAALRDRYRNFGK